MRLKMASVCLAAVGVGIVAFGIVATVLPTPGEPVMRTAGVASIGMGLFGLAITVIPFRRRQQWAWYTLWWYPLFWIAHFAGRLPPGKDHVHQVFFGGLALVGLLLPVRDFFPGPEEDDV